MKEQAFFNFVQGILLKDDLGFFQYSFRPKAEHIGGALIEESQLHKYIPDNIIGMTTLEQAWELSPIKLSYEVSEDMHIIYELSDTSEIDWIRNAKMIQIGLDYKGVSFKLYEFIFGYEHDTHYTDSSSIQSYRKAKESNRIHYYIGAFEGIDQILSGLKMKENFSFNEDVYMRAKSIVSHSKQANPMSVVDLFISHNTLHVTPMFELVMKFGDVVNKKMPLTEKPFAKIAFHVPYLLEKFFTLPGEIKDLEILFEDYENHPDFFNANKNILLAANDLNLDSKIYKSLKTKQLNEFAAKYCIIRYEDGNKKGVVLSNMMAFKLLKEGMMRKDKRDIIVGTGKSLSRYNPKEFIKKLTVTEVTAETMKTLLLAQGKKVGQVKWYKDELEGSLFNVREPNENKVRA